MDDAPWPNPAVILDDLPDDPRARIKGELAPGERLLWAARAEPRTWANGMNYLGMLVFAGGFATFSAVCTGTFFSPLAIRLHSIDGLLFLGGLAAGFVAFCLVATVIGSLGSWSWQQLRRRQVAANCYALTDRRAIIWTPTVGSEAITVRSYARRRAGSVHRVEYPDGSGDVVVTASNKVKPGASVEGDGDEGWESLKIEGVADVRRVEALVRATLIGHDPVTLIP